MGDGKRKVPLRASISCGIAARACVSRLPSSVKPSTSAQKIRFAPSCLFAKVSGKHQIREIMKTPYQHRNPVVRYTLFVIGWISFVLGMIGLLLPVVPTTPFLLLSAACFLRSSPRFYVWLTEHRWWGKYIRYYLNGQGRSSFLLLPCYGLQF